MRDEGGLVQWLERFDWRQEQAVDSDARTGRPGWQNCSAWMELRRYQSGEGWSAAGRAKKPVPAAGQVHNHQSTLRALPKV